MPKMKHPKKKREEEDEEILISTPSLEPISKEDGDDFYGVSHTKAKKKKQQNKKNGDNSLNEASQLNPVKVRKEEAEEDDKKKEKLKEKKKAEKEDEEEDASDLPGQKHKRPHKRDPLRIFFETLYQQMPDNELAAMWMMEWGLLPPEEAMKVYGRQLERREHQALQFSAEDIHPKEKLEVPSSKADEISERMIMKTKKRKNNGSCRRYSSANERATCLEILQAPQLHARHGVTYGL